MAKRAQRAPGKAGGAEAALPRMPEVGAASVHLVVTRVVMGGLRSNAGRCELRPRHLQAAAESGLAYPVDRDRRIYSKHVMDRAGMGRCFQFDPLSFVELTGDANIHRDASDPSRGVRHLFRNGGSCTNDIGVHRASRDAHDAENAAS